MTPDELEVAKLAALVGSSLKQVDKSMVGRPVNGPANKINPNNFMNNQGGRGMQQPSPPSATRQIKGLDFIEPPKSYSLGSETIDGREIQAPNNIDVLGDPRDLLLSKALELERQTLIQSNQQPEIIQPYIGTPIQPPQFNVEEIRQLQQPGLVTDNNNVIIENSKAIIDRLDRIIEILTTKKQYKPRKNKKDITDEQATK